MTNNNILVIGGANMEYVLKSEKDIVQGSKNFVEIEELFGGSGVNYSLRLMAYHETVYPILFLGDDGTGRLIYEEMLSFVTSQNSAFFQEDSFFVPRLQTPRSAIVVEGPHRTILSEDANKENIFKAFVAKRMQDAGDVGAVIIGHIHNDRAQINTNSNNLSTLYILNHFEDKETLVYANFGTSQLEYGFSFWKDALKKVDILQLNIHELRRFLSNGTTCSLSCLIEKIREIDIHMIITLDKFGALGIMREEKDAIFMARPITGLDDFVDSTGAGDAFCAGMVSRLKGKKYFAKKEFKEAMERARSWATFACKSYGGANACPNKKEIERYHDSTLQENEVVYYKEEEMQDIIALIDTMLSNNP
jgi:sugar/nucleoside kinase (ribokinase family)